MLLRNIRTDDYLYKLLCQSLRLTQEFPIDTEE